MNKDKVLFINGHLHHYENDFCQPIGLLYIAANIRNKGFEVKACDLNYQTQDEVLKIAKEFSPKWIGLSAITVQALSAYEMGNLIKNNLPDSSIVYGGVHPTFFPKEPFSEGSADFVIVGEGENTFYKLIANNNIGEIKGILYKQDGIIKENDGEDRVQDLDTLPFPAFDLVELKKYSTQLHVYPWANHHAVDTMTSRGCPYDCSYCASPQLYKRRIRLRSAENVIEEIKWIKKLTGINQIHFHDDNFFLDKKRALSIFELIIKNDIDIKWVALANGSTLNNYLEDFDLIAKSGCIGLEIGLETGDEDVLRAVQKKEEIEDLFMVNEQIHKFNIVPMYLTMTFNVGETLNSPYKTVKTLKELLPNPDLNIVSLYKNTHEPYCFGQFATPNPGSKFFEQAPSLGIVLNKSWNDYFQGKASFIPNSFLNDVPVPKKKISMKALEEYRGQIHRYLYPDSPIGKWGWTWLTLHYPSLEKRFLDFFHERCVDDYFLFLYRIYKLCNEKRTVKEISDIILKKYKKRDISTVCLGFVHLSMFGFIGSAKTSDSL